jgi:cytochrome c-type biogenesis protein CcmE
MDENLLRFLMVAGFMAVTLAIAAVAGELSSYGLSDPFESYYPSLEYSNVTQLLADMPLDRQVTLSGRVSKVLEDYVSQKGYEYQQFYLSDGASEVKVFCSKYKGAANIREGDELLVSGKFQQYYQATEIYTECQDISVIG